MNERKKKTDRMKALQLMNFLLEHRSSEDQTNTLFLQKAAPLQSVTASPHPHPRPPPIPLILVWVEQQTSDTGDAILVELEAVVTATGVAAALHQTQLATAAVVYLTRH